MKKYPIFVIVLVSIAGAAVVGSVALRRSAAPTQPVPPPANINVNEAPDPLPPPPETTPEDHSSSDTQAESIANEPVAYFPPPSVNLSGGKLGNQVVPGTDGIGDVSQLYFFDPQQALFMAVTEPDGRRAIWRVNQHGRVERVFAEDSSPGEIRILGDGHGVMYVMLNNPDRVYRTGDGFKSWRLVLNRKGIFWNIAADGKNNVYATLHSFNEPVLYRSQDNGFSWEEWIDFRTVFPEDAVQYAEGDTRNRLRHLHDVIYDPLSDALLLGTGDVARYALRSDDNGKTWEKFWHEGFTAHTAMRGGDRFLLCPDKLRGQPIALYDARLRTAKGVFDPGAFGFAGYCYSIINAEGMYYASFHTEANEVEEIVPKSGVVVSPDGETWYSFLEWEPLTNHARTNVWLATAPARIYASINGRLYAFKPLDPEWFTDKTPLR